MRYCSSFDASACPAQQVITVIYYRRRIALFEIGAAAPPRYGKQLWDLSVGDENVTAANVSPSDRSCCAVSLGQRVVLFTPARHDRYPEYIARIWHEIDAGQPVLSMAFDPLHPWKEGNHMTTYDLRQHDMTVDELFSLAADTPIHVIAKDGQTFVIGPAEDFEQEVARLRQSERFMAFLAERSSKKQGSISLDQLDRRIDEALAQEAGPNNE